jgi:hypothetical protein
MALGSIQPLTFPGGKGGWFVGLTTLPLSCVDCLEILRALTSYSHQDLSRPDLFYLIALTQNLRWSGTICASVFLETFFCPHSLEIGTTVSVGNISSDDWDSKRNVVNPRLLRPCILTSNVQALYSKSPKFDPK